MSRTTAHEILDAVLDGGSFVSWDGPPLAVARNADYAAALDRAGTKSGVDESVLTGEGRLRGTRVAVVACEFGFLGGSIGVAAAERIVAAVERATAERLPLLASPTSGGTRMQEGTVAFLQMVKIAAAIEIHKAAHLPYLVYLRNPTTGGVFASWGSLGHVTVAEPGALVGFLGPRVYQALYNEPFPDGVQTAENLSRRGIIDAVVPTSHVRRMAIRALRVMSGEDRRIRQSTPPEDQAGADSAPGDDSPRPDGPGNEVPDVPAWQSVMLSRRPERPGVRELLRHNAADIVPLSGTGQGEADRSLLLAFARIRGRRAVVLGQDRSGQSPRSPLGPGALREARRGMRLATQLRLPLVLVIDTFGAALSREAEEGGLAYEIASCLAELVTIDTPTVSVLLGQGTGGGALALLPADRVLAAQHAWLAPLPPEGASAIVHRDIAHAPEMAAAQGIRSRDLRRSGIVDAVIPERPDASEEPASFCTRAGWAIARQLDELHDMTATERHAARLARYRELGTERTVSEPPAP